MDPEVGGTGAPADQIAVVTVGSRSRFGALVVLCGLLAGPAAAVPSAPPAPAPSPATAGPSDDLAAQQRIETRLGRLDGMDDVQVAVQAGVARLEGKVVEASDRTLAGEIAGQQPGVTAVDNGVVLDTSLSVRFQVAMDELAERSVQLLGSLPLLLAALAIVLLAWWLGRALGRRAGARHWRSSNPYTAGLVQRLVQWLTMLAGLVMALDLLGATAMAGAVLGSAGVIGLVAGFAFKDIAENYVAGILLSLRRPFNPGELLRIEQYEGKVASLTARSTILVTLDGNRLSLPNALVFKSVVLNYTRNPGRRFEFPVAIDGSISIKAARQVGMAALSATPGVLSDPPPSWTAEDDDGTTVRVRFFGWVDQRESDIGKVRSEAIHQVREAFSSNGIIGPRQLHYVASLSGEETAAPSRPAPADDGEVDTSVVRDIDDQVRAERREHSKEDLIGPAQ